MTENVLDFCRWQLFPEWKRCLEKLDYVLHLNILDAADFGVAQHRKRLFITGVHRSVSSTPVVVSSPCLPHLPASAILDVEEGRWSRVLQPGRAMATLRRWLAGNAEYGERFLMPYFGSGSGKTGRSLNRPLGTVTTRDRWALVNGNRMRMLTADECRRAMGFHESYALPEQHKTAVHLLGNSVVPVCTKHVVQAMLAHLEGQAHQRN